METGGVVGAPSTSREYETGLWRSEKPIIDYAKCTKCLFCWVFCPEPAIDRTPEKAVEINLRYCKGCGICAAVCPPKAIRMVEEGW